jgi:hypothetical protein
LIASVDRSNHRLQFGGEVFMRRGNQGDCWFDSSLSILLQAGSVISEAMGQVDERKTTSLLESFRERFEVSPQ